ncbi:hypothetical protein P879_04760 [Paragonimus westermani]|uniref:Protein FAM221A n=1 Tax=Paragonimus westermani TaxID=34504 RepID=A0A8T0DG05_9TREM|nr:hypothetical protein P879_04760 [Paragonimus westermani]
MNRPSDGIKISQDQIRAINDYAEYKRLRTRNRIFISLVNSNDVDCILAGPQTECFCQHRLIQHKTDYETLPSTRPIPVPCRRCNCETFSVMPKFGTQTARCHCKHLATEHSVKPPNFCSKPNCKCAGFKTSVNCDCGIEFYKHRMVMETTQERLARGRPIGKPCPYQAMGGLTGFASLSPGIARMDESGAGGILTEEELNAPITSNDHPFLRTQAQAVYAHKLAQNDLEGAERERPEAESQMRRPGESELDYYERRYQEREKAKYVRKPPIKKP